MTYTKDDLRIDARAIVHAHGGAFIRDTAVSIDPTRHLIHTASGASIKYDVASFNIGSITPIESLVDNSDPGLYTTIFPTKPIKPFLAVREAIVSHVTDSRRPLPRVAVIGGGAAGFEIAANIMRLIRITRSASRRQSEDTRNQYHSHHTPAHSVTLYCGANPLGRYPRRFQTLSIAALTQLGIEIITAYVRHVSRSTVHLADGGRRAFDYIVLAHGIRIPALFSASGLPVDEIGALRVNRYLQAQSHPNIFGGGDCISLTPPIDRVGVYAVRQNDILRDNILNMCAGRADLLRPFRPQRRYFFALNLGDHSGTATKYRISWGGASVFALKDRFDRAFMDRHRT